MSRKYAIQSRLSDRDYRAFCKYATNRRATIDDKVRWLKRRGYRITRGAVWTFCKAYLQAKLGASELAAAGRDANLKKIALCLPRLSAQSVAVLADFAGYLAAKGE